MLFAQHFLQNAAGLLDSLNRSKTEERFFSASSSVSANIANEKECSLLYNIIDTLSNVFLNDVQKTIIAKDGFNLLMQPLVDQVSFFYFSKESIIRIKLWLSALCSNGDIDWQRDWIWWLQDIHQQTFGTLYCQFGCLVGPWRNLVSQIQLPDTAQDQEWFISGKWLAFPVVV